MVIQLNVQGMSCAGCAQSIERRLRATPGVLEATVDLTYACAEVTFDEAMTDVESLEAIIESLGFDVLYSRT